MGIPSDGSTGPTGGWTRRNLAALDFGCDEIIRSARMLGWDGVRWDGHHVGPYGSFQTPACSTRFPNFVNGYNVAFANPGSAVFLPTLPVADFHQIAKDHGLMMDERHSRLDRLAPAKRDLITIRSLARRTMKNGLAECRCSSCLTVLRGRIRSSISCGGLAAGQRYTYATTGGDFAAGPPRSISDPLFGLRLGTTTRADQGPGKDRTSHAESGRAV